MNSVFYIHWEGQFVAGNPKVNPTSADRNLVWCGGYTRMEAPDQDSVVSLFYRAFPETRIVNITEKP